MPIESVANVVIAGLLTGLVYGLMALGLSVIYGVVRIVNFAHGEMMALAMYAAVMAFAGLGVDPLWMLLPVALAFFVFGYGLQRALINPFIDRPEHSQFMLLLAVALILVNGLLVTFGPDARNVQVDYALDDAERNGVLDRIHAENPRAKTVVTRFKGLGEMSALQLRETTMARETRRLVQLTVGAADQVDQSMDMMLAKKRASDRREWLETKGNLAAVQP
jgi:branched-subunit amino acid ABC-type transport system permease component